MDHFVNILCFICQISDGEWYWDDQYSFMNSIQWSSAMFSTVFTLWNCYVITLLILYAPSHKGVSVAHKSHPT